MIEQERATHRGNPDKEARAWLEKLPEVEHERRGNLRLAGEEFWRAEANEVEPYSFNWRLYAIVICAEVAP